MHNITLYTVLVCTLLQPMLLYQVPGHFLCLHLHSTNVDIHLVRHLRESKNVCIPYELYSASMNVLYDHHM